MTFLGAWLVTEYVYNPDGTFAGIVRQRRELSQLANGRICLAQHCQPEASLQNHPMGQFVGRPVFELSVDGRYRRYHGPAVLGSGLAWGQDAMTGRGFWPDFGHNFRSFSMLPEPQRQLTGGKFFRATEMIANIVGVAVNEDSSDDWPTLSGSYWPYEVACSWQGSLRQFSKDGVLETESELQRRYEQHDSDGFSWLDHQNDKVCIALDLRRQAHSLQVQGSSTADTVWHGVGKQFGWLLELEVVSDNGLTVEMMEVLDGRSGHLIGFHHWLQDNELVRVDVIQLRPA